jgi:hypothetical protein
MRQQKWRRIFFRDIFQNPNFERLFTRLLEITSGVKSKRTGLMRVMKPVRLGNPGLNPLKTAESD